jgi:hypothetical protein
MRWAALNIHIAILLSAFAISSTALFADDCPDAWEALKQARERSNAALDTASDDMNCNNIIANYTRAASALEQRASARRRAEQACGSRLTGGKSAAALLQDAAEYRTDAASAKQSCERRRDRKANEEKQKRELEEKQKAEAEARRRKAQEEERKKAAENAAKAKKDADDAAKKKAVERPADPRWCIMERVNPSSGGQIAYNYVNRCDASVGFDIDDCDMGPNFEPRCKVLSLSVSGRSNHSGFNFKQQPNARNFR